MPVSCRHDMCSSVFVPGALLAVRVCRRRRACCLALAAVLVTVMDMDVASLVSLPLEATFLSVVKPASKSVVLVFCQTV